MVEPIPPAPPVTSAVLPSSPSRTRSSLMSPQWRQRAGARDPTAESVKIRGNKRK